MKKTLSIFLGLTLVSSVVFAKKVKPLASSEFAVVKSGEVIRVHYKPAETTNVRVVIYNSRHQEVYAESFKKNNGFIRPYNLSNLPDDEFTVEIVDESGRQVKNVTRVAEKTSVLVNILPIHGTKKYVVMLADKDVNQVTVQVGDAFGDVVFEQTVPTQGNFARVFDLAKLKNAKYISVKSEEGIRKQIDF
jgi:CxxC motif-containing protein